MGSLVNQLGGGAVAKAWGLWGLGAGKKARPEKGSWSEEWYFGENFISLRNLQQYFASFFNVCQIRSNSQL